MFRRIIDTFASRRQAIRLLLAGRRDIGRLLNSVTLSLVLMLLLWAVLIAKIYGDYEARRTEAVRTSENVAMLFEQIVLRSLGEVDRSLLYLRHHLGNSTTLVDPASPINSKGILSDLVVQFGVIDAEGMLQATTAEAAGALPIDLRDREHFKVHVAQAADELFISRPVIGRASGRWSVQLTRRLVKPDGSFGGVVVASFDPALFNRFYSRLNLWKTARFSLVGLDGVVRASGGGSQARPIPIGLDISKGGLMKQIADLPVGASAFLRKTDPDGMRRLSTVRRVQDFPLAIVVSITEPEIYASTVGQARDHVAFGFVMSLLIGMATWRIRNTERRAGQKTEQLQLTLDHMSQGIIMVTKDLEVPIVNRRFVELLQLPGEFLTKPFTFDKLVEYQVDAGEFDTMQIPPGKTVLQYLGPDSATERFSTYKRMRPNGTMLEVQTTKTADKGFVRTFSDITERCSVEAHAKQLAHEDALTGLANRRVFYAAVTDLVERRRVAGGGESDASEFAVLYLDLDRFKSVNDTLGHPIGDVLLLAVAERLRESLRRTDVIARLGGDEFAIIIAGGRSRTGAKVVAERLVKALGRPYEINGHQIIVSASIGIAVCPDDGGDVDEIMIAADLALYAAKAAGKNGHCFFQREMTDEVKSLRRTEGELRSAIQNGELLLHYQPIIDLKRNAITGLEALVRWKHPTRGLVPPMEFIPVAEDSGLIIPLGAWALTEACRQVAQLPDAIRIAVNLSPIQFTNPNFIDTIRSALAAARLEPARLELEITERILMQDNDKTLATLHAIRDLGVQISMDDFGTGYSSLSYLQSFPFSKIKVDRAFVSRLGEADDGGAVIKAVIDIARSLGMQTTAEGVETEEQHRRLLDLGCDQAQGYLYSRPVAAGVLPQLFATWSGPKPATNESAAKATAAAVEPVAAVLLKAAS